MGLVVKGKARDLQLLHHISPASREPTVAAGLAYHVLLDGFEPLELGTLACSSSLGRNLERRCAR